MNPRARTTRPDPQIYLPAKGLTPTERSREQDAAAGGRVARLVTRADGATAVSSVALRCYHNSRRVYAYLRWSTAQHSTAEVYLGDVSDSPDRATALRTAWCRVADRTTPAPTSQPI